MKNMKYIVPAAAVVLTLGATSCADELGLSVQDPQTTTEFNSNAFLAKVYGSLVLTGQTGGSGDADMKQFDEGNSSLYRRLFEANELGTDETIWTWQGDAGIPELTNLTWDASHSYTELTYYRLMYNVTLCNSFLDQTEGTSDAQTLQNRAEVRFVRALNNFHFIDLYGKAPYKEHVSTALPEQRSRKEMFDIVVSELESVIAGTVPGEQLLEFAGTDDNYGRADQYAAKMLLARLYLNAEVYTGTAQWDKAYQYADEVISGGQYKLCTDSLNGYSAFQQVFMGDNGENANARQEIIFPIRQDGNTTRSYGGSVYTIASCTGSDSPTQSLTSSQWTCNRARQSGVLLFFNNKSSVPMDKTVKEVAEAAADNRALFFSGAGRTFETEDKTTFTAGLGIMKWDNTYCDTVANGKPHNETFADTDIPLIRLAEAYMTRAEAAYRMGKADQALADINVLRDRANAASLTELSERTLIDEWGREFYFEGRRRSDLVRFNLFTTGDYVWDWKGGSYEGIAVNSCYNIYPIPSAELAANSNMTQNDGYAK